MGLWFVRRWIILVVGGLVSKQRAAAPTTLYFFKEPWLAHHDLTLGARINAGRKATRLAGCKKFFLHDTALRFQGPCCRDSCSSRACFPFAQAILVVRRATCLCRSQPVHQHLLITDRQNSHLRPSANDQEHVLFGRNISHMPRHCRLTNSPPSTRSWAPVT